MRLRMIFAAGGCLALLGCGQREPAPEPAAEEAPISLAAPDMLGAFDATSTNAMASIGDVAIEEDAVRFSLGLAYATQVLSPIAASDPVALAGDPADLALGVPAGRALAAVERRAVIGDESEPGAPAAGLCGDRPTTHLLIAASTTEPESTEPQWLWLAAFAGADPPGPQARDSALCAAFVFSRETAF